MQVISVVRDFEMYNRLVLNNKNYREGTVFKAYDNNKENKFISVRYNEFLDSYDYSKEDWFLFCHEDWELLDDIEGKLAGLDTNCLYGPVGVTLGSCLKPTVLNGFVIQTDKKGERIKEIKNKLDTDIACTFDCSCLIVHSSLIEKHSLRFDENLSYDLYVEDFCINAMENHNIPSRIIWFTSKHYSYGNVVKRFYDQIKYLGKKWSNVKKMYCSIVKGECITRRALYRSCWVFHTISRLFS